MESLLAQGFDEKMLAQMFGTGKGFQCIKMEIKIDNFSGYK